MARLFLIRHGQPEAAWGGANSDPGLSTNGRAQAEAVAYALVALGRFPVVCSPMRRCRETAAPYADLTGASPVTESRVSEIVAPSGAEDRARWLQERFPWRSAEPTLTWASLESPLHAWRDALLAYAQSITIDTAVFTHFIAINTITAAALKSACTIVTRPDHASITELEVQDGALRLVRAAAQMQADDVR